MRSADSGSRTQPATESARATHARRRPSRPARSQRFIALSAAGHEDVALVAHGPDELRVLGIGLDFLAQPHDAKIDAAIEWIPVPMLAETQDTLARKGLVGMLCERLEQIEFERGHRHFTTPSVGETMGSEVEHAVPDAHSLGTQIG